MDNFVVYAHKTRDGVFFYVGSGRPARAYSKSKSRNDRGKKYDEFVESIGYDFDIEILEQNLSKEEAIEKEIYYHAMYSSTLLNSKKPNRFIDYDNHDYSELEYCEDSPTGLRWVANKDHRGGMPAGCKMADRDYFLVRVGKRLMLNHRIVCVLNGLSVNGKVVDHIDGNGLNNKIANLRVVTGKQNGRNTSRNPSVTGINNVTFDKSIMSYRCTWTENGRQIKKSFSVNKYGDEVALNMAIQALNEAIERLAGTDEEYSSRCFNH